MKKILVLLLLGVITILTPLSFKANYYSIDQPVIDLNNYTLNEVFTDTINDLEQYKITSILDLKIYEGLSLRDIFEDGNLVDVGSWISAYGNIITDDNIITLTITSTNANHRIEQNITGLAGNYYVHGEIFPKYSNRTSLTFGTLGTGIDVLTPTINSWNTLSNILTSGVDITIIRFYHRTDTSYIVGDDILYRNIFVIPMSLFTTAPSKAQLDEWLSFYIDPSTIVSFDTIGNIEVYKVGDGFYNLTAMKTDQVYSTFNLDTFDNLLDAEITDQFGAWQTLGIEDIEVLSLTEFQTFAPALDQEDMLYWFNYYNLILEYDEVQAGILSDLEITILIIALVLFIIGIALAIYFHHKIMFFVTGLLWFVPIVIVPNIFIITFCVIMIIIFGLLAFYNSQGKDFD